MEKYLKNYMVYKQKDSKGNLSKNNHDNYLLGKYNSQIYRYDKTILCVYFPVKTSYNNIEKQLKEAKINFTLFLESDDEAIYFVDEVNLESLHRVLKFKIKGKVQALKSEKKTKEKAEISVLEIKEKPKRVSKSTTKK